VPTKGQIIIIITNSDKKKLKALAEDAVADINSMDGTHEAFIFHTEGREIWWGKEINIIIGEEQDKRDKAYEQDHKTSNRKRRDEQS